MPAGWDQIPFPALVVPLGTARDRFSRLWHAGVVFLLDFAGAPFGCFEPKPLSGVFLVLLKERGERQSLKADFTLCGAA